jgi:hypothetical protein
MFFTGVSISAARTGTVIHHGPPSAAKNSCPHPSISGLRLTRLRADIVEKHDPIGYGNVITTISHSPLISSTPLLAWSHKSGGGPLTEHTNPNVETNRRS